MTSRMTVAVTGPTGTFGFGLLPLLELNQRVTRVVGIARRPFDPAEHGWTKLEYQQGDVRSRSGLEKAFAGADVVVHLAFMITGTAPRDEIREINVDGTLNAFRAAVSAGASRFVYASSVAAYGFHDDNPDPLTEDWPVRPAEHLFYAQEKAEIEQVLAAEAARHPELELYVLRPSIVLGPNAAGAKTLLPAPLMPLVRGAGTLLRRSPLPLPVSVPDLPMQFVDEDDVGQALLLGVLGNGPPGVYNIAGEGVLSARDVAREVGLTPLPGSRRAVQAAARRLASLPFTPPAIEWAEALSRPMIMDTEKAFNELGWRPRHTGLEALRRTLG